MSELADTVKEKVKEQFGLNAASYIKSAIHAQGDSLERLVKLLNAPRRWVILDVATGTGHTALALAPRVRQVIASDLTYEMLFAAQGEASNRKVDNVKLVAADAEQLPFSEDYFDLVTCRIAAHHFPEIFRFLDESKRVLRPGGLLAIVDNIVPNTQYDGKKRPNIGRFVNAFEKLRDPSHVRCLSLAEWRAAFYSAGIRITHEEVAVKELDFDDWVDRMGVNDVNRTRLEVMLLQAPKEVVQFLAPRQIGRHIRFSLSEALIIGVLE